MAARVCCAHRAVGWAWPSPEAQAEPLQRAKGPSQSRPLPQELALLSGPAPAAPCEQALAWVSHPLPFTPSHPFSGKTRLVQVTRRLWVRVH